MHTCYSLTVLHLPPKLLPTPTAGLWILNILQRWYSLDHSLDHSTPQPIGLNCLTLSGTQRPSRHSAFHSAYSAFHSLLSTLLTVAAHAHLKVTHLLNSVCPATDLIVTYLIFALCLKSKTCCKAKEKIIHEEGN